MTPTKKTTPKTRRSGSTARKALHAYLSDDAHETWHAMAAENGVSVSGLLEALAPELVAKGAATRFDATIKSARKVDVERRRR